MDQAQGLPKQIPIQDEIEGDTSPGVSPENTGQKQPENISGGRLLPPTPKPVSPQGPPPYAERKSMGLLRLLADEGAAKPKRNVLVLQWLTYVFWWWFVAAATWLVGVLADIMVTGSKPLDYTGSLLALPAIVMIVSLVAAVVADMLYSRYERGHGGRAARILQTVHAVLFAVTIMTGVITIAYYLIGGVFGAGYTADGRNVALITSSVSITLYALAFARIMFPTTKGWARTIIMVILAVIAGALVAVALSGPAARARDARDDALVEAAVIALSDKINNYATDNKSLPAALKNLDFSEENSTGISNNDKAKEAFNRGLVTYTPNTQAPSTANKSSSYYYNTSSSASLYYRLCVTYKTVEKGNKYSSYYNNTTTTSVPTMPDTSKHEKGQKCYDLRTSSSSSPYDSLWYNGVNALDDTTSGAKSTGSGTSGSTPSSTTGSTKSTTNTVKN